MEPDRPAAGGELENGLRYYVLVDELELGQGMLCESYGVKVTAPDGEARELCGALGTCLREHPDTWDWTMETLAAALGRYGAHLEA